MSDRQTLFIIERVRSLLLWSKAQPFVRSVTPNQPSTTRGLRGQLLVSRATLHVATGTRLNGKRAS